MADNHDTALKGADDAPVMPPTDDGSSNERVKGGRKRSKLVLVGFGVATLAVGYLMFAPSDDGNKAPVDGQNVDPRFVESGSSASIEGNGAKVSQRSPDTSGGVGRERAEVMSEIDEREVVLDKIERGETAVIFGDPEMVNDKEPEPTSPAPVFGDISPREKPAPSVSAAPSRAPMTNTPSAIRPSPKISNSSYQAVGTIDQQALMEELARLEVSTIPHEGISYSQYQAPTSSDGHRHTMTPALDEGSEAGADQPETGSMVLPGDETVAYMSNRISSDQPDGMVRADILAGKVRGARLLGKAKFQGDRLLILFDQMVYDNEIYAIQAMAVDPDTLETSVRDGIDRRLFTRFGVPLIMGVASMGIDYQASRVTTRTTEIDPRTGEEKEYRTNDSDSFGEHALAEGSDSIKQPLADIAQGAANVKPEVWANPGVIGIQFISPVPQ